MAFSRVAVPVPLEVSEGVMLGVPVGVDDETMPCVPELVELGVIVGVMLDVVVAFACVPLPVELAVILGVSEDVREGVSDAEAGALRLPVPLCVGDRLVVGEAE